MKYNVLSLCDILSFKRACGTPRSKDGVKFRAYFIAVNLIDGGFFGGIVVYYFSAVEFNDFRTVFLIVGVKTVFGGDITFG